MLPPLVYIPLFELLSLGQRLENASVWTRNHLQLSFGGKYKGQKCFLIHFQIIKFWRLYIKVGFLTIYDKLKNLETQSSYCSIETTSRCCEVAALLG